MSDTTLLPSENIKPPTDPITQITRNVEYASLPPDVTLKHEEIGLKHPTFVGSVTLMIFFSLIMFFLPFLNGVIGGSIGGYYAAQRKRAWIAAAVNVVAVPILIGFLTFLSEQPGLTFLAGLSFREWVVLHILGTIIGTLSGVESRPYDVEGPNYRSV